MRYGLFLCAAGLLAGLLPVAPAVAQSSSGASATESTEARPRVRPRPRIVIQSRRRDLPPTAQRHCRSWLAQEYRVSGAVIVPKMECWWQ